MVMKSQWYVLHALRIAVYVSRSTFTKVKCLGSEGNMGHKAENLKGIDGKGVATLKAKRN